MFVYQRVSQFLNETMSPLKQAWLKMDEELSFAKDFWSCKISSCILLVEIKHLIFHPPPMRIPK
jgi:hypothetical protein